MRHFSSREKNDSAPLRSGFTLVELLVVIAVIGVLVGLLLPAVQAAREAARRMQCGNNLKQLGIALHNYESAHQMFPFTSTSSAGSGSVCGNGFYSWMAMLLPYIEQGPLYDSIDFRQGLTSQCDLPNASSHRDIRLDLPHANALAASTIIPTLVCPSDILVRDEVAGNSSPAPGSYAANIGWPMGSSLPGQPPISKHNGFMGLANPRTEIAWHQMNIRHQSMTDGLSNTAAVSERLMQTLTPVRTSWGWKYYEVTPSTPQGLLSYCGATTNRTRNLERWIQFCDGVSEPDPFYSKPHGRAWISGWTLAANTYMHVYPPNRRNCHLYGGENTGENLVSASSRHTGGAQTLMGDGRIVFNSNSIDRVVWWAIGSRDGGEVATLE